MHADGNGNLQRSGPRMNIRRILRIILGAALIAGTFYVWFIYCTVRREQNAFCRTRQELEAMPDHDYVSEIKSLIKDNRYGEAVVLCEDVEKLDLPCAPEVSALKTEAERKSRVIWYRLTKAGRAFITGNHDGSIEEIGSSMVSDMVMYGDVRDLVKQGWYKITGQETDPLLAALAAAGLATEFVDVADWAPAVLKALRNAGAITGKMADSLIAMFKKIAGLRKVDQNARAFFMNTKNIVDSAGIIRAEKMFRNVDKIDDLAAFARLSKSDPALAHLVSRHSGKQAVEIVRKAEPGYLKLVARKGRLAIRLFKSYHKHGDAIEKTFLEKVPESLVNTLFIVCGLIGFVLLLSGGIPFFGNKRDKSRKD